MPGPVLPSAWHGGTSPKYNMCLWHRLKPDPTFTASPLGHPGDIRRSALGAGHPASHLVDYFTALAIPQQLPTIPACLLPFCVTWVFGASEIAAC